MKIAIIAPSPVPFAVGGAENLCWGLLDSIRQYTSHQADLIKVPTREFSFSELIAGYKEFSRLDISHFDVVISSKYPAWMVQHPNHICYMVHRLRGLYDTYHFTGLPQEYVTSHTGIRELQKFMSRDQGNRKALPECFDRLEQLHVSGNAPADAFDFPGPFIREVIHFLDGIGLSQVAVKKFAAISRNVANRRDYFPEGSAVEVIYPPSTLKSLHCGAADYLFTISRLDGPKRVSLLIEAMKLVKSPIELRIAGTGPDAERLRQMAGDDKRIEFLGFINDSQAVDLYANALAVPYVPYDEDYGLITIEAMMSGKPVLTTKDSGGPNEFVKNEQTGYSAAPDPAALAERIDYLYQHPEEARLMGMRAHKLVQGITWENTICKLLELSVKDRPRVVRSKRKRIIVASTFPVYPPLGGGQLRIFHLYKNLAREFDVELVTICNAGELHFNEEIAPGLREIRIPKSLEHETKEAMLSIETGGVPVTDVAMPQLYHLTPDYVEALRYSASRSDYVIASHPYLLPAILQVSDKPIWYEAQDVEIVLKRSILPDNATGRALLKLTEEVESECCEISSLIMVCSTSDGKLLSELYDADPKKLVEVPNGVDSKAVTYVSQADRAKMKERLGLKNSFNALFMGSWHGPNIDAVRHILKFAAELPDVNFVIVGSVGSPFQDESVPSNVGFMGVVDDPTKDEVLGVADVALNPMDSGSGTNMKMLEYCTAGVPVVSTPCGARGLALEHEMHIEIAEIENFPDAICSVREKRADLGPRMESARRLVVTQYDWAVIARNFANELSARY